MDRPKKLERSESTNVRIKQPPRTDDFENDPEAGPSGLQAAPSRNNEKGIHRTLRYANDSSSDESGDEREVASAMWLNAQESYRFNRKENESGDARYFDHSCRFEPLNVNEASASTSNQDDEIIELSENESVQSNVVVQTTPAYQNLEVLTAPDLQLDWASDTSSDNEIVCTIQPRSPDRDAALNFSRSNLNAQQAAANDLPAIDLTASDDEESAFPQESNSPSLANFRYRNSSARHILSRFLRSNHHDEDRADR